MTTHAFPGVAKLNANYSPKHRENMMAKGIGFIPLGDRQRAVFEYGDSVAEERDSVDIATSKRR